jgi:hypothetical protein
MKMRLFTFCILLFYINNIAFGSLSIYVVPSFFPTNREDGTLEYPFSTIEQARDNLRRTFRLSLQRIALYPTYHFVNNHTLTFDERDSLTIYTKMTDNEQKQIHLSRKKNLIELDFPIISGGIRLTDWINNKGVHTKFNFILDHKLFLLYIDLEYCCT